MTQPPPGYEPDRAPGTPDPYQQPQQDPYAQDPYQQPYPQGGYGQAGGYEAAAQTPGRSGGFFPFPHRSWRTSRGTQVTVGGCCLPLPLGCLTTVVAAGVVAGVKIASSRA